MERTALPTALVPREARVSILVCFQLFVAMSVIYYVAAHIGLALQAKPENIAVFWPASGVAAGAVVMLWGRAVLPLAAGVMVGTVIANLSGRGDPVLGVIFGACNAFEAISIGYMLRRLSGDDFCLDSVLRVVGFIVAGLVGTAMAAAPAALALSVLGEAKVPFFTLWRTWLESDALGVLAIAPLMITLPALLRAPPEPKQIIEGVVLLLALSGISYYVFGPFTGNTVGRLVPVGTILFPIVLWIAARFPPAFAAAAVASMSLIIVLCAIGGVGTLGDPALPLKERVGGAQLVVMVFSLSALSLAALFAERRRTEAALMDANHELRTLSATLEQRVLERTKALARENEERLVAEKRMADYRFELAHVQRVATAGELAAFIAHELNQPLAAISSTASACMRLDRGDRLPPEELERHLADMASEAKRASRVIKGLYNLVRKQDTQHEPIDLGRVVENTLPLVRSLAERARVTIDFQRPTNLPEQQGNAIELGQMVLNLVRNAIDAVSPMPAERRRVTISVTSPDPTRIILDVVDCGPRMAPDVAARMRERFFTTKADGLGMGLPICLTIAEAHDATLDIAPIPFPGVGTRACVIFPVGHSDVEAA